MPSALTPSPAASGSSSESSASDWKTWRKAERERLLAERQAIAVPQRRAWSEAIAQHLGAELSRRLGTLRGKTIGIYWPIRGEPLLLDWMEGLAAQGAQAALPVVVERAAPLAFHAWAKGDAMVRGFWSIPVPAVVRAVAPDVLISPVVGFSAEGYRLGYGGGYYDRTMAAASPEPLLIGVGFGQQRLAAFEAKPHDVAMHAIVTEAGVAVSR